MTNDQVWDVMTALRILAPDIKQEAKEQRANIVEYYFALSDQTFYRSFSLIRKVGPFRRITKQICMPITADEYLDSTFVEE